MTFSIKLTNDRVADAGESQVFHDAPDDAHVYTLALDTGRPIQRVNSLRVTFPAAGIFDPPSVAAIALAPEQDGWALGKPGRMAITLTPSAPVGFPLQIKLVLKPAGAADVSGQPLGVTATLSSGGLSLTNTVPLSLAAWPDVPQRLLDHMSIAFEPEDESGSTILVTRPGEPTRANPGLLLTLTNNSYDAPLVRRVRPGLRPRLRLYFKYGHDWEALTTDSAAVDDAYAATRIRVEVRDGGAASGWSVTSDPRYGPGGPTTPEAGEPAVVWEATPKPTNPEILGAGRDGRASVQLHIGPIATQAPVGDTQLYISWRDFAGYIDDHTTRTVHKRGAPALLDFTSSASLVDVDAPAPQITLSWQLPEDLDPQRDLVALDITDDAGLLTPAIDATRRGQPSLSVRVTRSTTFTATASNRAGHEATRSTRVEAYRLKSFRPPTREAGGGLFAVAPDGSRVFLQGQYRFWVFTVDAPSPWQETPLWFHGQDLCVTPDATHIASPVHDMWMEIVDLRAMKPVDNITANAGADWRNWRSLQAADCLVASPVAPWVIGSGAEGTFVYDVTQLRMLRAVRDVYCALALSHDGQELYAAAQAQTLDAITQLDLATLTPQRKIPIAPSPGDGWGAMLALALSPDAARLYLVTPRRPIASQTVEVIDCAAGRVLLQVPLPPLPRSAERCYSSRNSLAHDGRRLYVSQTFLFDDHGPVGRTLVLDTASDPIRPLGELRQFGGLKFCPRAKRLFGYQSAADTTDDTPVLWILDVI